MQTEFTEDQEQFREVVVRFLQDKSPPSKVRELMASEEGCDQRVWNQLCGELGLAGTHIPEEYGGFGFGPIELGIVAEEMGRYLYCGPFLASSVMAGYALLNMATEAQRQALLPGIASGKTIATLVLDDLGSPERLGRNLRVDNNRLTGTASIVIDAHLAKLLVIVARDEDGLGLYKLDCPGSEITIRRLESMDATRKLSKVEFNQASAERIGDVDLTSLWTLWDQIGSVLSHEMMGGTQHLFDTTIDYTKMRFQFGRPIGSFQGLKHRCADLLMEIEFARAATHHAARCLDSGEGEPWAASMAKAMAADVYMKAAREAVQMRGGIGFTWEEDTHLWFKRAKSSEVLMGTPAMHRERMMCLVENSLATGI